MLQKMEDMVIANPLHLQLSYTIYFAIVYSIMNNLYVLRIL